MAVRAACAKALWQGYMWYVQGGNEAGKELGKEVGGAFWATSWRLDHIRFLDLGFSTEWPLRSIEQ